MKCKYCKHATLDSNEVLTYCGKHIFSKETLQGFKDFKIKDTGCFIDDVSKGVKVFTKQAILNQLQIEKNKCVDAGCPEDALLLAEIQDNIEEYLI